MFADYGETAEDIKAKMINNIIVLVLANQKEKIPIDYDGIINSIASAGASKKDIADIKNLLYKLRDANPYK